jgi:hypothetical protein
MQNDITALKSTSTQFSQLSSAIDSLKSPDTSYNEALSSVDASDLDRSAESEVKAEEPATSVFTESTINTPVISVFWWNR